MFSLSPNNSSYHHIWNCDQTNYLPLFEMMQRLTKWHLGCLGSFCRRHHAKFIIVILAPMCSFLSSIQDRISRPWSPWSKVRISVPEVQARMHWRLGWSLYAFNVQEAPSAISDYIVLLCHGILFYTAIEMWEERSFFILKGLCRFVADRCCMLKDHLHIDSNQVGVRIWNMLSAKSNSQWGLLWPSSKTGKYKMIFSSKGTSTWQ